ncbi:hypothetical protein BV25DRAFT_1815449 [Artomyces pyxidatus]|uniref:Uncharacterized protein n=1 Tax=Artomyces pyxidatus TaxID=48021 RepID=A0ACB8SGX1_9AGAM|nr:hypothetical protein BV25DRAFT_1815449 [Artomyces pyxidatus]
MPSNLRIFTERFSFLYTTSSWRSSFGHVTLQADYNSVIALPATFDFACISNGAQPIHALTSSYVDRLRADVTIWKRILGVRGAAHSPEAALTEGIAPGHCWAFPGFQGQLGINLSHPVHVTGITVLHTSDPTLKQSAPRNLVLWGLLEKNRTSHCQAITTAGPLIPMFGPNHVGVQLLSAVFDGTSASLNQSFAANAMARACDIPFQLVVVQILGNWGKQEHTCVYRLQVHGNTWES